MAMTPTCPVGNRSAATFRAGSMPTIISSGCCSRRMSMAAAVAVLQATTRAFTPREKRCSAASRVSCRTASTGFCP